MGGMCGASARLVNAVKCGAVNEPTKNLGGKTKETPMDTCLNLIMDNADLRVESTCNRNVDPVAVSGGGLLTDRRKVVVVTVRGSGKTVEHYIGGRFANVVEVTLTTVPFIISGMVSEAINTLASMDMVKGSKVFTNDFVTHFKTVTTDLESISLAFFVAMVLIGSDASSYVTESHRSIPN